MYSDFYCYSARLVDQYRSSPEKFPPAADKNKCRHSEPNIVRRKSLIWMSP